MDLVVQDVEWIQVTFCKELEALLINASDWDDAVAFVCAPVTKMTNNIIN